MSFDNSHSSLRLRRNGSQAQTVLNSQPLISIGLPVYNGEQFISQTLDSLRTQDYANLELIISDNCSSDRTPAICEEYQAKEHRIRYYRNTRNLGAAKNFNRTVELSSGKYFMWAGDHDLWDPSYLSRCISVLEEDPTVVLAYSRTMLVDLEANPIELLPDQIDTRGMSAPERYVHLIRNLFWCNMVYGVIRGESLKQTGLVRNIFGSDHLLLAELALKGAFAQVPAPLFYRRKNRPDENIDQDTEVWKLRLIEVLDPAANYDSGKATLTDSYRALRDEHLGLIRSSSLSRIEKLRTMVETLRCYASNFGVEWPGGPLFKKIWTNRLSDSLLRRIGAA
jgi:glycosyltransferase involved in cell wall biosynthesis